MELENTTQNVEASLCEDAELETPKTIQKCGLEACPIWQAKEWSPCNRARCFDWNTGKIISNKIMKHYCTAYIFIFLKNDIIFKPCNEE